MDYRCIVFSQRPSDAQAPRFCLFQAPVGEIQEWSTVPRLAPEEREGVQRAKNDFKVQSIRRFLEDDARNTIPTAIVITVAAGSYNLGTDQAGFSTIHLVPENRANVFVIDGQHRLYGLSEFNSATAVPIVAILDATNEEKAFQFIVINNKVSKVSTDHIRALSINFTNPAGNQDLERRLRTARLTLSRHVSYVGLADESVESPFYGIVALPGREPVTPENGRVVVPAAIESSIAYIQSKKFKQLADDESTFQLFLTVWSTIKEQWPNAFGNDSKLLTKVGVTTMTRYLVEAVDYLATYGDKPINIANAEDVVAAVSRALLLQTPEFWTCEWTMSISDTKAVRDSIELALKSIQQNIRDNEVWSNEISLIKTNPST